MKRHLQAITFAGIACALLLLAACGSNGVDGTVGTNGTNGTNSVDGSSGTNFLSGMQKPMASWGKDENTYLDMPKGAYYQKTAGAWVLQSYDAAKCFLDVRDSALYSYRNIDGKVWMTENLIYSGDNGLGQKAYTKGWCYGVGGTDTTQHQESSTCDEGYGRLYNWTDAMNIDRSYLTTIATGIVVSATANNRGLCPAGWHMPNDAEWTTITPYINNFLVLSTGWRYADGGWYSRTSGALFWSASEDNASNANNRGLSYTGEYLFAGNNNIKANGFSLRCTRD